MRDANSRFSDVDSIDARLGTARAAIAAGGPRDRFIQIKAH